MTNQFSDANPLPCDEDGLPLSGAMEQRFASLDREQARLDARREQLSLLVVGAMDGCAS